MEKVRVDKWLWAARFFKTRSLASKAVSGGHVHVNGQRVKAARAVQVSDELEITKGALTFTVTIVQLRDRRGPANVARQMYEEHPDSIVKREQMREERRLIRAPATKPDRRPDKRERRKIREFLKKH
ncbi:MAG: RNA-binding protein [Desulfobulbus propionicus]|nr:MAG: RNA-binding protein [Desulfobulbus propionicus]PIE66584.1 MAG: RNA-binding protein [Desulfobacterales bacterium]